MGGRSRGGSARTPVEDKNTLHSFQRVKIIDLLAEGIIANFAGGTNILNSLHLGGTPVIGKNGEVNHKGVKIQWLQGTGDQGYIPDFDTIEKTIMVNSLVKKDTPIVRTVTDSNVTGIRVALYLDRLSITHDNGDTKATSVSVDVDLVKDGVVFLKRNMTVVEKGQAFNMDCEFERVPEAPFQVRMTRLTNDSNTDRLLNSTQFSSYTEIVNARFTYPHSAIVAIEFDSRDFGGGIPARNFLITGRLVKVPSNYDPKTRTYTGAWDGLFKSAATDNPVWIFYDAITEKRFGLGDRFKHANPDKWTLYQQAKYCDELVDDGYGGKEPRFTCNINITDGRPAREFLADLTSCFRGMPIWDGMTMSAVLDRPSDPVATYTNSNVVDGLFTYSGVPLKSTYTTALVSFVDKRDSYRTKVEEVTDDWAVARFGRNVKRITAFGATSRGQAVRYGKYILESSKLDRQQVVFVVGAEGIRHKPFDVITIADSNYAGKIIGGRVSKVTGKVVTLDTDVEAKVGDVFTFVNLQAKQVSTKVVRVVSKNEIEIADASGVMVSGVWSAALTSVKPRYFRALGIKHNPNEGTYTITATQHTPQKEKIVDEGVVFNPDRNTATNVYPSVSNGSVGRSGRVLILQWDARLTNALDVTYEVRLLKEGLLYRKFSKLKEAKLELTDLPSGEYVAEVRAVTSRGEFSEPILIPFSTSYNIQGLRTTGKIMGIQVNWDVPPLITTNAYSELWYSKEPDVNKATKVARLAYPQAEHQLTGIGLTDKFYFWVRLEDEAGNQGSFFGPVLGEPEQDSTVLVDWLTGQITETQLGQDVIDRLIAGSEASENVEQVIKDLEKEIQDRKDAVSQEQKERLEGINKVTDDLAKEVAARIADVKALNDSVAKETKDRLAAIKLLNDGLSQEIIDRKAGDSNLQGQITTIKSSTDANTAAIQTEIKARTTADEALGKRIDTVVADTGKNTAAITAEATARATADEALGKRIDTVQTNVGKNTAAITAETTTRVKGDEALGKRIDAVVVNVDKNTASIVTINEAVANTEEALATVQQSLKASLNNITGNRFIGRDFPEKWINQAGAGVVRVDGDDLVAGVEGASTSQYWAGRSVQKFPIAQGVAYKITFDLTSVENLQDAQTINGVNGIASDGETWVNGSGANTLASQHYFTTQKIPQGERREWSGLVYHKDDAVAVQSQTIAKYKRVVHENVAYITPVLWLNYSAKTGSVRVHSVKVEVVDIQTMTIIDTVSAELTEFKKVQTTANEAMTQQINAATAQVADNKAAITAEAKTRADADTALGKRVDAVTATAGNNTAAITAEVTARADADTALGKRIDSVNVSVGQSTANADLQLLQSVTGDRTLSSQTLFLSAQTEMANASLALQQFAEVTRDRARAAQLTMLSAEFGSISASFTRLQEVTATELEGMAKSIETLKVEIDENISASITDIREVIAGVDGKVSAMVTMKTEAMNDGTKAVAGLSFGVDGSEGIFTIMADKFAIVSMKGTDIVTPFVVTPSGIGMDGSLIVSGTIKGTHIAADQTLSSPHISGGSINIANGRFTVTTRGEVEIKADATKNVGMRLTNERIDVYDDAGKLQIRIGRLS